MIKGETRFATISASIDRPFVLDLGKHGVEEIHISADVRWSPENDSELVIVVEGDELTGEVATELGYFSSKIGYYKYFRKNISESRLDLKVPLHQSISRIKIHPWRYQDPVVFQGMTATPPQVQPPQGIRASLVNALAAFRGGKEQISLECPYKLEQESLDEGLKKLGMDAGRYLKANLMVAQAGCDERCADYTDMWFHAMDLTARKSTAKDYGRKNYRIEIGGRDSVASVYKMPMATLVVPADLDSYMFLVGDKSRNMIKKAIRLGYRYQKSEPENHLEEIRDIRVSNPMRQGKPIPQSFYELPKGFLIRNQAGCAYHDDIFVGVFLNGRLISFVTALLYGNIAKVNHIMCHDDHVKNGVMNFNVYLLLQRIMEDHPYVRFVNYLYYSLNKASTLNKFKESVGFEEHPFLVYDSLTDFEAYEKPVYRPEVQEKTKVPTAKPNVRKTVFRRGDLRVGYREGEIETFAGAKVVALELSKFAELKEFISSGLTDRAREYPEGTYFAIPFISEVRSSLDDGVAQYILRRFKGTPISDDGYVIGFKGSAFQAVGFMKFEVPNKQFDGLLIVEKVR
ncbi:hypothetical protein WL93_10090 [Burkholderia diffusa]|uniref:hypothetical protein n=1 Tax=Burkholderia diffusa TaxID=488732 RepID=UPI0007567229|nr:hypothetical protein [Burkholderia diffusa]KWF93569.1 hypothetical protein WL93_10090 [Burkholderia diffusa]